MNRRYLCVLVAVFLFTASSAKAQYAYEDVDEVSYRENAFGITGGGLAVGVPESDGIVKYIFGGEGTVFYEHRFTKVFALRIPFTLNAYSRNSKMFDFTLNDINISQVALLGGLGFRFYGGDPYGIEFFVGPSGNFGGVVAVDLNDNKSINLASKNAYLVQAFADFGLVIHLGFLRIEVTGGVGYQGDFPNEELLRNLDPEHKLAMKLTGGIGFDF